MQARVQSPEKQRKSRKMAQMTRDFYRWHLETFFVPYDPRLAAHRDRLAGFLGGYRNQTRFYSED